MDNRTAEILKRGVSEIDSTLCSENVLKRLEKLYDEISFFNPVYKLVSASGDELVIKHILDCIAPLPLIKKYIKPESDFADLGSGSGLPGIVLASAIDEDCRFSLVERMGRRAGFLRNTLALLGLSNKVEVVEKDLSEVNRTFDFISFRAFRRMKDIAKDLVRITHNGSVVFAYKSNEDNVNEDIAELNLECSGSFSFEIIEYKVPFLDAERCLLVFRRI